MVSDVTSIEDEACFNVDAISPASVSGYDVLVGKLDVDDEGNPSDFTRSVIEQFQSFTKINASSAPIPEIHSNK